MRYLLILFSLLLVITSFAVVPAAGFQVDSYLDTWHDAKRDRDVPVKIYYPADKNATCAVIIFSHGLGGSRDGYEYLGKEWASRGFISVHLTHIGSDTSVWKGKKLLEIKPAMDKAAVNPTNAINRPLDITFAIDTLLKINRGEIKGILRGRIDESKIGVAGHSFGSFTALATAGIKLAGKKSFGDDRVKAVIAMSSPVTGTEDQWDTIYGNVKIPVMHMTGTKDSSNIGKGTKAEDRRIPYDHIKGVDQYLITFIGGDHMIFSGRKAGDPTREDAKYQQHIKSASDLYWDAYLMGNSDAMKKLKNGILEKSLKGIANFEMKN
jgi:predicted dienelactone hydrolase